jgi:hypothetical protein
MCQCRAIGLDRNVYKLCKRDGWCKWIPDRIVTGIYVITYALTYLLNPQISNALNKYGERIVLSLESASLIVLFLGYAFINNVWVVISLFILDSIFFNFSIGLNTYLQKTADPEDLGSSTAVGFTINHISAVIIPVFGGVLWMFNWRLPFLVGTGFALLSLYFTQMIATDYHARRRFSFSTKA